MEGLLLSGGILWVIYIIIGILWIILPLAVFGIKSRLDKMSKDLRILSDTNAQMLYELKKTNLILGKVHNVVEE